VFGKGEIVFHEGDPGDSLHLVRRGRFSVRTTTPHGESAMLAILGPGAAFGEMALLDSGGGRRSTTVEALEPAETRAVAASVFRALKARRPQVVDAYAAILATHLRRANRRVLIAHFLDSDARVRAALVDLVAIYDEDGACTIPLTQDQIAALSGTARGTVNRVLGEEAARGTITLGRGRVAVLKADDIRRRIRGLPDPV
jgi:CRP-like cAMP-binding protein